MREGGNMRVACDRICLKRSCLRYGKIGLQFVFANRVVLCVSEGTCQRSIHAKVMCEG